MILSGWAIALIVLTIVRLIVAIYRIGKGNKTRPMETEEQRGWQMITANLFVLFLLLGELGAYL